MKKIKLTDSNRLIPVGMLETCNVDGTTRAEITRLYPTRKDGAYYLDKFGRYLLERHGLSIPDYCAQFLEGGWPKCPISNEPVGYDINGKGVVLSRFKKGKMSKQHCKKFKEACEKFSVERKGAGNPMFNKKPWNLGLTKETHEALERVSQKKKGQKHSEKTKENFRRIRKEHPLKARHTTPHSKETIEKLRKNTARLWALGVFSNRETSIEKKVRAELNELNVEFKFQEQIGEYFVADFFISEYNFVIECQGDWFHCNPRLSKFKTPKYPVQLRNVARDKSKRKFYQENGIELLELWETDINNGKFKKQLKCKLEKLSLLKKLEK